MTALLGELSALTTAVLWAGSALVFTSAVRRVGAMQVNLTRLGVATLLLAVTVGARGTGLALSATQAALLVASGVVGLVFGDTFLFQAFGLVGARTSMLVMALAPALAALLAFVFLGETLSALAAAGAAATLVGVAIVVRERPGGEAGGESRRRGLGVFFALLGALGQAGNLVLAKLAFSEGPIDGFVATLVRVAASLVLLLPPAVWSGAFRNPLRVFGRDRRALLLVVAGSVVGPYLGITLSLVAVAHAEVGVAATLMATVPIVMLPMARIVFGEALSWRAIGGACIAVAGVAVLFWH